MAQRQTESYRNGRNVLVGMTFVATAFLTGGARAEESRRPNVVVFLADDAGWGDYSLHDNKNLQTPHIDSLSRQGARFDRFFVCPVCAPTRAEFLTGRYFPRVGVQGVSTGQERLNLDERTVADVFQKNGYATGCFGKWHSGSQWPYHPLARGFGEYYGFTSGHWGEYFDPPLEHNGKFVRGKGYIADDLTNHAIEFIEKHQARPFFCYLAFNTPHSPWAVPEEYWRRFQDRPMTSLGADGEREDLATTRCVLAMMENLDTNVGRVLSRLEELRLSDNTIVIYFSDNGPNTMRFNGGMKGKKGTTDEGGLRSPLHVRWPTRIAPGTLVREIASAIDLAPTLASLAKIPWDGQKPLDGQDLSSLLTGSPTPPGERPVRLIFSSHGVNVSVRTQQYRLDQRGALFDMEADPGQTTDRAADLPEVAARLREAAAAHRQQVVGARPLAASEKLPKAKDLLALLPKDDRPFPVGYREFPLTPLPARDGVPHGGVRRSAPAPNCSYFVHWTSLDDSMTWDVQVATSGTYEVTIYYACPLADAGSRIEVSFQKERLAGIVQPGFPSPLYENQDTLPRPAAESRMKEFRPLALGTMKLPEGRGQLTLRALEIPGATVMDVRLLTLTLRPE